jgi:hypothetical protein
MTRFLPAARAAAGRCGPVKQRIAHDLVVPLDTVKGM